MQGVHYQAVQLDSDDRLKPDVVEKIVAVFNSDPRIGMVIGSYEVWGKCDKTGEITRMDEIPVVTHDEWTEENGRNYGEDYDLVMRSSERYRIGRVWKPIYDVIRHSGGIDHTIDPITINSNDNATYNMRCEALERRIKLNK